MNQLQKKLTIIGTVHCSSAKVIRPLIAMMDSVVIKESKWHDRFKQEHPDSYPLDLTKMEPWCTYAGCLNLTFRMLNSKFVECDVMVFNGDVLDGHRTNVRFTATLKIPYKFLSVIKDEIKWRFERHCAEAYESHLERQKDDWIRHFANDILTSH